jgi:hypothetical protein
VYLKYNAKNKCIRSSTCRHRPGNHLSEHSSVSLFTLMSMFHLDHHNEIAPTPPRRRHYSTRFRYSPEWCGYFIPYFTRLASTNLYSFRFFTQTEMNTLRAPIPFSFNCSFRIVTCPTLIYLKYKFTRVNFYIDKFSRLPKRVLKGVPISYVSNCSFWIIEMVKILKIKYVIVYFQYNWIKIILK